MGELTFRIRDLIAADLDEVLAIERASFSIAWTPRMFLSELEAEVGWRRVVVQDDDHVGGYLICRHHGDLWHIMDLAVRPDLRGLGLGGRLLDEFLQASSASGVDGTLEVRPSNTVALSLYRSRGFAVVGRRPGYYHDNREDALIMVRPAGARLEAGAGEPEQA